MGTPVRIALAVIVLMVVACGDLRAAAAEAAADDWSALSTTVFRDVGKTGGTSVTALAQDGDGYLWVGGQSGLARWDGYRFRPYVQDSQNAGALPDSYINALQADGHGRLWIGTTSGGLARYDPDHDRFVRYRTGRNGPSAQTILALGDDGQNGVWVGTTGGLDHFVDRTMTFEHFRHAAHVPGSLPDNVIHSVILDHGGTLWVATDDGIVRRERGSSVFTAVSLPAIDGQTPVALNFLEDSERRIWIGTSRHGVYLVGADRRSARPLRYGRGRVAEVLANETIDAIREVRGGVIWFGTRNDGIISLDVAARRLGWMQNDPVVSTSLPQNTVHAIYRDRAGLVWVGTLNGLRRSDPAQVGISTMMVATKTSPGLTSVDTGSIFAGARHRVWFGLGSEGIDLVDPAVGRVGSLRPGGATPLTTVPNTAVNSIVGFPGGPVYLGTDLGLYQADANGHHPRRTPLPSAFRDTIRTLYAHDKTLWIGSGAGLWRLNPYARDASGRVRRLRTAALTDNRVLAIAAASPGRLWAGTYSGLNLVDTRTGGVEQIRPRPRDPTGLTAGFISALLTDRRGRLWVGTYGGGIEVLERRDSNGRPRFRQLSLAQGLPNVNVDALLLDRQGRVWAATDDGMAVIEPDTFSVRALNRADGVELSSYWLGSAAMVENGDLLFGASGGVTIVRPSLVRNWLYKPGVVITDVRIGGRPVPSIRFTGHDGPSDPYVIAPKANSIAVEFAALDFSAPEQNRYAYRLDGFDADWTETDSNQRLAAYTNLAPGTYTLELRGSNRNGVWSTPVAVPIRVAPAWNQTIAFKLAQGLVILGILTLVVQLRTSYSRRRERELEHQVSQRTAELEALAIELRASKEQLELIAYHDPLTDLPNRRMFAEQFRTFLAAARRRRTETFLLLIDLDRFKAINDTKGHDAGDAVLLEAAIRLRSAVRESDCVARLGGDEFAILLADGSDDANVDAICTRVIEGFRAPIAFKGHAITTSPSIGIAVFPRHGATPEGLYKAADLALYEAKRAGRNTWRWSPFAPVETGAVRGH